MKRIFTLIIILALILSFAAGMAEGDRVSVTFKHSSGADMGPEECRVVAADLETMTEEWYAATQDVTIDRRLRVSGTVNLVLCSGATMTVNGGISIPDGSKLNIWGQDNVTAKLTVTAEQGAGIGGETGTMGGEVSILGGNIDATGGDRSAGIGGGSEGAMCAIRIYGGRVNATGGALGAGIGTGCDCGSDLYDGSLIEIEGGEVTAYGGFTWRSRYSKYEGGAGIGGGYQAANGNITITGGHVIARGHCGASGIGGGSDGQFQNHLTIRSGTVQATGHMGGAGIGSGYDEHFVGTVNIYGGTVTATNDIQGENTTCGGGAGIGGGEDGDMAGTINITGGTVNATGTCFMQYRWSNKGFPHAGAGIGAGPAANCTGTVNISGGIVTARGGEYAAGIGGGAEGTEGGGGEGGKVNITGGTVIAYSGGHYTSAIGHGHNDSVMGDLYIADHMMVQAGNDGDNYERVFTAEERVGACQYRHNARIEPCDHRMAPFSLITETAHQHSACPSCGRASFEEELHNFNDIRMCTVCGYQGEYRTITFDANGGKGAMNDLYCAPGQSVALPDCAFVPPGTTGFGGWLINGDVVAPGEAVTVNDNLIAQACWQGEKYTITFDGNGGNGEIASITDYQGTKHVLPGCGFDAPDWSYFIGWQVNDDAENLKQPLDTITLTGDTIVKARWMRDSYTVLFDAEGGDAVAEQTLLRGEKVQKPADPTQEGVAFDKWMLNGEAYDFDAPLLGDITLRAAWTGPWTALQGQIDSAADGDTITLTDDVTALWSEPPLVVPAGKHITLDLNGHTVDRARTVREDQGWVITVEGALTVKGSGVITGGWGNGSCGGVYVDGGSLTLLGGEIRGNEADGSDYDSRGGGVLVSGGTFTMSGGNIVDNRATGINSESFGGGVYVGAGGLFTMTGGTISGNEASYYGGGVYLDGGTFTMTGGRVSGNTTTLINQDSIGGGVYLQSGTFEMTGGMIDTNAATQCGGAYVNDCVVKLSGSPVIIGNRNLTGPDNVFLISDARIIVSGELKSAARIGVNMARPGQFTSGLRDNGGADTFQSDDTAYGVRIDENGEAYLGDPIDAVFGAPDFTLPNDVKSIEKSAFEGIAVSVVYIPDSCETIGAYAFKDCKSLRQIRIPAGCIIEESAFDGCEHVTIFGVPGSAAEQYCESHDNCEFAAQ